MAVLLGSIKKEIVYNVYFYHKRNDDIEYEQVIASNEIEAINLAIKKHKRTFPNISSKPISIEYFKSGNKIKKQL